MKCKLNLGRVLHMGGVTLKMQDDLHYKRSPYLCRVTEQSWGLKRKKGTRESFIWKYPQVGCADPNSPKIRISLTTWLHALLLTEWLYRANNWLEIRISAPLTWFHEVLLIKRFFRANNCLKIRISEATRFYAVLLTKRPHRTNNWPPIVHRTGQRTRQCIPTHAPTHTDWRAESQEGMEFLWCKFYLTVNFNGETPLCTIQLGKIQHPWLAGKVLSRDVRVIS